MSFEQHPYPEWSSPPSRVCPRRASMPMEMGFPFATKGNDRRIAAGGHVALHARDVEQLCVEACRRESSDGRRGSPVGEQRRVGEPPGIASMHPPGGRVEGDGGRALEVDVAGILLRVQHVTNIAGRAGEPEAPPVMITVRSWMHKLKRHGSLPLPTTSRP